MSNRPVTNRLASRLGRLIVVGMLVQLAVIGYVFASGYQSRVDIVTNQRAGCERNKLDRVDNATFQTAQKDYITSVTSAKSVKEDVKIAARKAVVMFRKTSAGLTERSKVDCSKAFPDATLFP